MDKKNLPFIFHMFNYLMNTVILYKFSDMNRMKDELNIGATMFPPSLYRYFRFCFQINFP